MKLKLINCCNVATAGVLADSSISTNLNLNISGSISAASEEDIVHCESKPFTAMDCLKAELIIATNMKCKILQLKDLEKVANFLAEKNFSPHWDCEVCITLNEFDKEICHHALEKSKEWVKIWINETPSFDVCGTLSFLKMTSIC